MEHHFYRITHSCPLYRSSIQYLHCCDHGFGDPHSISPIIYNLGDPQQFFIQIFKNMTLTALPPIVSVVIPSYNCAHLILETIASVKAQTYEQWELLIINDGSTDDTIGVIIQFLKESPDDRIQLISKPNGGVSNSRNFGAGLATGEIIAFLDADDRWFPDHLAAHVEQFKHHAAIGISFGRVEFITDRGEPTGKTTNCQLKQLSRHDFLYSNPTVTTSNLLVRSELFKSLQGFDETINHSEDMEFLFRASGQTEIEGLDRVLVQYRIQTTGLSSTLEKMNQGWHHLMSKASISDPQLIDRHYNAAHAKHLQYLARQTLRLDLPSNIGINYIHQAIHAHWPSVILRPRSLIMTIVLYHQYLKQQLQRSPLKHLTKHLTKHFTKHLTKHLTKYFTKHFT
jgi:glycosyltransferase involved in cell wall biosynthesis